MSEEPTSEPIDDDEEPSDLDFMEQLIADCGFDLNDTLSSVLNVLRQSEIDNLREEIGDLKKQLRQQKRDE